MNILSEKRETPLSTSTSNLHLVLKAWPVIALATIGLCFLTQQVAKLFGIELPDQANIDIVRRYAGWNWTFAFLCLQVLVLMPAIEELVFRGLLFKAGVKIAEKFSRKATRETRDERETGDLASLKPFGSLRSKTSLLFAILSSALFSAAHYIAQPWPDAAFIALFFFGLAQCWLYRRTDRLWCPMLNHALFNLTNLLLLFFVPGGV